jgi:enoyl-CoA hydratase
MNFRTITYEKLGAVLRITANRPEVLNAQSRVMIVELDEAFRAASADYVEDGIPHVDMIHGID